MDQITIVTAGKRVSLETTEPLTLQNALNAVDLAFNKDAVYRTKDAVLTDPDAPVAPGETVYAARSESNG